MTTAYTKTEVGSKLFTVEWNLSAGIDEVAGDVFEAKDCELISMFGLTPLDTETRLFLTNHSTPTAYKTSLLLNDAFLSPLPDSFCNPPLPPPTRFVWPGMEPGAGDAFISLLFREI